MKRFFLLAVALILKTALFAQVTTFNIDSGKLNKPLMLVLDTILKNDQDGRLKLPDLKKNKPGSDSLWKVIRENDALNLVKVNYILDKYGWLGPQDVGMMGSQALFLVIQHSGLQVEEKYLSMIQQAVKDGKTYSSNLALLEDRIAIKHGKPQMYGSQLFTDKAIGKLCFYPMVDPDHIDDRRKTMGLEPIADYANYFKITWDLEEYKKMLPEIEEAAKHL